LKLMAITRIKLMTESLRNVASRKGEFGRGKFVRTSALLSTVSHDTTAAMLPLSMAPTAVLFQIQEIQAEYSSSDLLADWSLSTLVPLLFITV